MTGGEAAGLELRTGAGGDVVWKLSCSNVISAPHAHICMLLQVKDAEQEGSGPEDA